jgi:hypothetical protein
MDRSSKALQELDGFRGLQGDRRSFTSCRLKCACRVVVSMRISIVEKRLQARSGLGSRETLRLWTGTLIAWRDLGVRCGHATSALCLCALPLGPAPASALSDGKVDVPPGGSASGRVSMVCQCIGAVQTTLLQSTRPSIGIRKA